jgi:hypothetical protein
VRGDVTSVGGRIDQSPGATINGGIHEVRMDRRTFTSTRPVLRPLAAWNPFTGWFKLFGTAAPRAGHAVAMLVALVAARPSSGLARALQEPWLSGHGPLAQLLFVPVLVLTVVILAVSLIGIPLLVLVPFGVIAFLLAVLIGFTGVALRLGRWAVGPTADVCGDGGRHRPGGGRDARRARLRARARAAVADHMDDRCARLPR